jgi:membrane-bound lytic murein transglycosylase B
VGGQCPGLDWTLLAAIGAVETNHGRHAGASLDPTTGEARPWIFGPRLDGAHGTAAIPIGNRAGWWGLTGPWQQAVGPMQFLPPHLHWEIHPAGRGTPAIDPTPTADRLCAANRE